RDRVLYALKEAAAAAEILIESLRDELEDAYVRIEDLTDQVLDLMDEPLSEERDDMDVSCPPNILGDVQTKQEQRMLPDITKTRENYPLWDGLMAYYPAALCEVARWSKESNDKHNPGEP